MSEISNRSARSRAFLLGAWAFLWAVALPLFAQDHKPADPAADDSPLVQQGRTTFQSSCGFCHGPDATGARAPDLVRSAILTHDNNGDLLTPFLRVGRPAKGMPAFPSLTAAQISAIVSFLHHQAYAAAHNANVPGDYPASKLLTGSSEAGKAFFFGDGKCSNCHSLSGDLKGIASRLSPVDLQQAIVFPENAHSAQRTATVVTREGERFEGVVLHQDEFRIGITCQDGWYRSFSVPDVRIELHDPLAAHRELTARYTDADMHNLFAFLESLK